MFRKIFSIFILSLVLNGILMPGLLAYYYWNKVQEKENCSTYGMDTSDWEKMKNNGDKFLLALLKRTCENNKKNQSFVWVSPVFAQIFYTKKTEFKINDQIVCLRVHIPYINLYSFEYLFSIFHPPSRLS